MSSSAVAPSNVESSTEAPVKDKKIPFKAHVHLEKLIKSKFGVILEVRHETYSKSAPASTRSGKPIVGSTSVFAFKSKEDAIAWRDGTVKPLASAVAKCGINDTFTKVNGLTRALNRLYRNLKEGKS